MQITSPPPQTPQPKPQVSSAVAALASLTNASADAAADTDLAVGAAPSGAKPPSAPADPSQAPASQTSAPQSPTTAAPAAKTKTAKDAATQTDGSDNANGGGAVSFADALAASLAGPATPTPKAVAATTDATTAPDAGAPATAATPDPANNPLAFLAGLAAQGGAPSPVIASAPTNPTADAAQAVGKPTSGTDAIPASAPAAGPGKANPDGSAAAQASAADDEQSGDDASALQPQASAALAQAGPAAALSGPKPAVAAARTATAGKSATPGSVAVQGSSTTASTTPSSFAAAVQALADDPNAGKGEDGSGQGSTDPGADSSAVAQGAPDASAAPSDPIFVPVTTTPTPTTTANAPPPMAETVSRLASQIVQTAQGPASQFSLTLHPAELGGVQVKIQVDRQGAVSAALTFSDPQTAADMKAHAADLKAALNQAGFDVSDDGLSFNMSGQGQQNNANPDVAPWAGRAFRAAAADADDLMITVNDAASRLRTASTTSGLDIRI